MADAVLLLFAGCSTIAGTPLQTMQGRQREQDFFPPEGAEKATCTPLLTFTLPLLGTAPHADSLHVQYFVTACRCLSLPVHCHVSCRERMGVRAGVCRSCRIWRIPATAHQILAPPTDGLRHSASFRPWAAGGVQSWRCASWQGASWQCASWRGASWRRASCGCTFTPMHHRRTSAHPAAGEDTLAFHTRAPQNSLCCCKSLTMPGPCQELTTSKGQCHRDQRTEGRVQGGAAGELLGDSRRTRVWQGRPEVRPSVRDCCTPDPAPGVNSEAAAVDATEHLHGEAAHLQGDRGGVARKHSTG